MQYLQKRGAVQVMDAQSTHIVVMGVAGCGKSEVGQRLAARLNVPLIEGDQFHSIKSVEKMRDGVPLTDADRAGWLRDLGEQLANKKGAVLACSALRRAYRDTLRNALLPGPSDQPSPLCFLFLDIDEATSQSRVATRTDHFYPASLVSSQFATLESPVGEARVLALDGTLPIEAVASRTLDWLSALNTSASTLSGTSEKIHANQ
jgi:gluconokinase